MSTIIDEAIKQQIILLQDRLAGEDDPAYIRSFVAQIRTLKTTDVGKLDELIAIRKKDLKDCKNIIHPDTILTELDSLEWIQKEIAMQT